MRIIFSKAYYSIAFSYKKIIGYKNEFKKNIRKGDFITQSNFNQIFAIFGGDVCESSTKKNEKSYTLICYYNPSYYEMDDYGEWRSNVVFEIDLSNIETCEYTIDESDLKYWRLCTENEKKQALTMLANDKGAAWEESTLSFRKLMPNEHIRFSTPSNNNVIHTNNHHSTRARIDKKNTNIISNTCSNWKQTSPIVSISQMQKMFVMDLCEKLKFRFYDTNYFNFRGIDDYYDY